MSTGKFTFLEQILNMGHGMQLMEETMTILNFKNDSKRINALEEIEIMKATTSYHILNIMQNNRLYNIIQTTQDQTVTSTDNC